MPDKPLRILISGAGVAGASLALMLARQPGFKMQPIITIIERSSEPRKTGQAVDIRGPGVDVMRKLGWEQEIKRRHTTEQGLALMDGKGNTKAYFPATGDEMVQSSTSEYEILRGELVGMLLEGVDESKEKGAQVNVVHGETIQSMENRDDGIHVHFSHGKLEDQRYDVVVAADGISSRTRSMIFGREDKREHVKPSGMYLSFFSIPRIDSDDRIWHWANFPGGLAIHLRPHRNEKTMGVYFSICTPKKERDPNIEPIVHADVETQKKYLRQVFERSSCTWQLKRFLDGLDAADDFYMSHSSQVKTPQWAKGRCVILGDAAFATMGVGTSLALAGAYCIAGELSKIEDAKDVPMALQRYEEIYKPYVKEYDWELRFFPQVANPQTVWGNWLWHAFVGMVAFLRVPQLIVVFSKWFGGGDSKGWKLPEYGW
ncbi:FAD/NAD(P)-binding domain-containing protein [Bimuria novae-zelandiae CBS 107.79]|uniref:FAD/NAD(P)-binding domain-containing protein n=1 Tax=Bimuria novae-zelandiae CBS 107.79 TaxID=1447943 RepID=A0A6A5UPQ7_9PLEO|nr:FAD/NAD(P)-binding domain-containing protein [Bimuria novae-zelandiae CBS 107.79]